jgi:two-component system KDP operon response regulator KdpE
MQPETRPPEQTRILVLDDDPAILKLVKINLVKRGYGVEAVRTGAEAIAAMQKELPDIALIDLFLPEIDGIEVCEWIRQRSSLPIIVLSAASQEEMKVRALDIGADDYITKPFGTEEMMARIRAVLRRTMEVAAVPAQHLMEFDGITIDLKQRRVSVNDEDIRLTRTEFALLAELAQNADSILSHDELLERVWGPEYRGSSHYLHVYLGRIRSKLGPDRAVLLETVPGFGYVLHSRMPQDDAHKQSD